jgi:hypothetical protein
MSRVMLGQILGTVGSYADLHALLRARCEELQISRLQLDEISGMQSGYSSKVLSLRPQKRLGTTSLPLILPALGVKLVLMVDEQATAALQARNIAPRRESAVRSGHCAVLVSRRHLKRIQRLGGLNSRARMSKKRASELGRNAARARWQKAS